MASFVASTVDFKQSVGQKHGNVWRVGVLQLKWRTSLDNPVGALWVTGSWSRAELPWQVMLPPVRELNLAASDYCCCCGRSERSQRLPAIAHSHMVYIRKELALHPMRIKLWDEYFKQLAVTGMESAKLSCCVNWLGWNSVDEICSHRYHSWIQEIIAWVTLALLRFCPPCNLHMIHTWE